MANEDKKKKDPDKISREAVLGIIQHARDILPFTEIKQWNRYTDIIDQVKELPPV